MSRLRENVYHVNQVMPTIETDTRQINPPATASLQTCQTSLELSEKLELYCDQCSKTRKKSDKKLDQVVMRSFQANRYILI